MKSDSSEKDTSIDPKTEEEAKYEDYSVIWLYFIAGFYTILIFFHVVLEILAIPIEKLVDFVAGKSAEGLAQEDHKAEQTESEEQKQGVEKELDELKAGLASGAQFLQEVDPTGAYEDDYMTLPPATEKCATATQILGEGAESGSDQEDLD